MTAPAKTTAAEINPDGFIPKAKEVMARIKAHNVVVIAAGIAFYGLLALIPTIVATISIYSLVTDPADLATQIKDATQNMEEDSAKFINDQVSSAVAEAKESGTGALIIGILVALWAASGALSKLMNVIALAYGAIEGRGGLKVRALSYGLTAGGIVTVALIGFVFGGLPALLEWAGLGSGLNALISIGSYVAMLFFMMFAFTVLYRYGPDRTPKTPWKNPGAIAGAGMFLLFAVAFSLYFRFAAGSLPASYSILGAIAAIIIVIGAEVNAMNEDANIDPLASVVKAPVDKKADPLSFGKAAAAIGALIVLGKD